MSYAEINEAFKVLSPLIGLVAVCVFVMGMYFFAFLECLFDKLFSLIDKHKNDKGTRELTLEKKVDLLDDNVQTLLSKFKYHFEYDEGADEDEK